MKDSLEPKDFVLDGYQIIGDFYTPIALPLNSSKRHIQYILAAAKAYSMGYSSIDYVLKKYGEDWFDENNDFPEPSKLLLEIVDKAKFYQSSVLAKAYELKNLPDILGLTLAGTALVKLQSSFKAAAFLLFNGFFTEAYCLLKLILEQISWAYSIFKIQDEKLFKVFPTKTINNLNFLIPNAGKIYGLLNKMAHIDPKVINYHLDFSGPRGRVVVSDIKRSLNGAIILLKLSDIYGIVMETIFSDYFLSYDFLDEGTKNVSENRSIAVDIDSYRDKVKSYRRNNS